MHYKMRHVYVGLDLHKAHHTAVIINCWHERLGEIQIENQPSAFDDLMKFVKKHTPKGMTPVYGLEDTGGNGRALAVHLVEKKQIVKEVNSALSYNERMSNATIQKSDSWDAFCIAKVLFARLDDLPDANPQDIYWTIGQLVARRNSIVKHAATLKNQLHQQLSYHYPSYKKFFCDIDGKAALAFWEKYPAPYQLESVGAEELAVYLRKASHNICSTRKAEEILELVKKDGETKRNYQASRDFLVVNMVQDMKRSRELIKETEAQLRQVLSGTDYKLDSMDGISTVTAAELIAEIGDIRRFSNADKLARFAGIAPIRFSSGGIGKDQASGQGNRVLNTIFHNLAVQQIQVAKGENKKQRNPVFYEYYQRKLAEGKTKKQALICVMKRHLFLDTKQLSVRGKPYEELYFQADPDIAHAWQKAQKGELNDAEKEWFKKLANHEIKEKEYMDGGMPLRDSSTWNAEKDTFDVVPEKNAHDKADVTDPNPPPFPDYDASKDFNKYFDKDIEY